MQSSGNKTSNVSSTNDINAGDSALYNQEWWQKVTIKPGDEEIIICRCEDISKAEILRAIKEGFITVKEIKLHLRTGMGMCQGRTCTRLIQRIIAEYSGKKMSEIEGITVRAPAVPVPLGLIAGPKEAAFEFESSPADGVDDRAAGGGAH